jgi:hypothetical protein
VSSNGKQSFLKIGQVLQKLKLEIHRQDIILISLCYFLSREESRLKRKKTVLLRREPVMHKKTVSP